ncbi:MAG TPA: hypothetical protein VGJ44_10290 [Kribbellaceae bacterium]|jgi:cytochrome P450
MMLTEPRYAVVPEPEGAPYETVRWLRREVARFREGLAHTERRAAAAAVLDGLDLDRLRADAAVWTARVVDDAARSAFDAMELVARTVPAGVLAVALGIDPPEQAVAAVRAVAPCYQPGTDVPAAADDAVRRLAGLFRPAADVTVAARIGVLVQAYDATAGLIGNAIVAARESGPGADAGELVRAVLRDDPPVRGTRRVDPAGRVHPVDLTTAGPGGGPAPFGRGAHACPGESHAVAIAEGAVGVLLVRCEHTAGEVPYTGGEVLRIPARLMLRERGGRR